MKSNEFAVPFVIEEDEVNTLDTVPVDLGTFGSASKTLVRVPVRVELWRDAGTAYAVTPAAAPWDGDSSSFDDFDTKFAIERTLFPENALWIRAADARGERGTVLFRIPTGLLENTTLTGLVVMPEPGQSFVGGPLTLTIEAGTPLSGGTGSLHGVIYFEEFSLPV